MARVVLWKSKIDIAEWANATKAETDETEELNLENYPQKANEKYFDVLTKIIQLPNFMISYSVKKSNPCKTDIAWIRDDQAWWFPFLADVEYYVDEGVFCREIKIGDDAIISRFFVFRGRPTCRQLDKIMNGNHDFDDLVVPIGNAVLQSWMDWYSFVDNGNCPIPLAFVDEIAEEAWNYVPVT